jgi:hypothetical protein
LRSASENGWSDNEKRLKSNRLSNIMPVLEGICPVCFILTCQRINSLPVGEMDGSGHRPFYDCGVEQTFQEYVSFQDAIRLRKPYFYCYTCCLPQSKGGNRLEPKCHADWSNDRPRMKLKELKKGAPGPGKRGACPWSNIVQASLFALYFDEACMQDLVHHFNYTDKDDWTQMTLDEWRAWLCIDLTDQGEYWKGLEVFLFKMAEYGLTGV